MRGSFIKCDECGKVEFSDKNGNFDLKNPSFQFYGFGSLHGLAVEVCSPRCLIMALCKVPDVQSEMTKGGAS